MTPQEARQQAVQAKAHLKLLERSNAPQPAIDEAQRRLDALISFDPATYQATTPTAPEPEEVRAPSAPIPVEQLPLDVRAYLEELTTERDAINAQKVTLSNTLHTIPDGQNCKDLVAQILKLREAWKQKQDAIRVLLQTGTLPQAAPVVKRVLPEDEEKLRYQIQCLQSNINKAQKRSRDAKNESTRQRNAIAIAQWEAEIEQMKAKLSTL